MAVFTMKSKVYIWGMHARQNGGVFEIVRGGGAPCISELLVTVSTNEPPETNPHCKCARARPELPRV